MLRAQHCYNHHRRKSILWLAERSTRPKQTNRCPLKANRIEKLQPLWFWYSVTPAFCFLPKHWTQNCPSSVLKKQHISPSQVCDTVSLIASCLSKYNILGTTGPFKRTCSYLHILIGYHKLWEAEQLSPLSLPLLCPPLPNAKSTSSTPLFELSNTT